MYKTSFLIIKIPILNILLTLSCLFLMQCGKPNKTNEDFSGKKVYRDEENGVEIIVLKKENFQNEILSNGKIIAMQKNNIQFELTDKLQHLYVKNGDFVRKGQLLASLNTQKYQQRVAKAEIELKKAKFQFEDMLVGRGIFTTNKDSISKSIYDMASSRTGYDAALLELNLAQSDLQYTKVTAPFNGKVANMGSRIFENVTAGENFLTLIDDTVFEVEFFLIESEIDDVSLSSIVEIVPFAVKKTYKGHISSINPLIEKNGTVLVKAFVKNDGQLKEGMNVRVRIEKSLKGHLVVPKSAVVQRDNQEVLFKLKSGKAYWTYVKTILENSTSYSVIPDPERSNSTIGPGDTIITTGNLNLGHNSKVNVRIKQNK